MFFNHGEDILRKEIGKILYSEEFKNIEIQNFLQLQRLIDDALIERIQENPPLLL